MDRSELTELSKLKLFEGMSREELEEAETNALRALSRLPDSKEVNITLKAIRKRLAASDAVSRKKKIHNKKEGANK